MKDELERILIVLAVGSSSAIVSKRARIPYNVALVVVGLLLVLMDVLPKTPMDPELILLAFLPILVFEGALFADAESLRVAGRPILALTLPGVAVSLFGTAAVAAFALRLPFAESLLLGALLSITDTVSVLLAFRTVRVPRRLAAIMEGESLFNDGTALVLVGLTAEVVVHGRVGAVETAHALARAILGGVVIGGAVAAVSGAVLRRAPDHLTATLASIVLVFATSLLADRAGASAVIAVVVLGLAIGRAARRLLEPSTVLALHGFWETAGFITNVFLFLLVGMQIEAKLLLAEAWSIAIALIAVHAGRAAAVYGCFALLGALGKEQTPIRWQHAMVAGNIKGALSMAAVLALPGGFPDRDRLVAIVFGVTFVTLVTQALPFRRILVRLGVTLRGAHAAAEGAKVTLLAARRGIAELDELLAAGLVSRKEHARRRAEFQQIVIEAEESLRGLEVADRDPLVELALLHAQKAAVVDASRRGLLSHEASDAAIARLDRALIVAAAHQAQEGG